MEDQRSLLRKKQLCEIRCDIGIGAIASDNVDDDAGDTLLVEGFEGVAHVIDLFKLDQSDNEEVDTDGWAALELVRDGTVPDAYLGRL